MKPDAIHAARILVVDDEPHMVAMITATLRSDGYDAILSTTDPGEVVGLYRRESPDLIVLDMKMPGVDGLQLLELLAPLVDDDEYLPVLVVTGDPRLAVKLQALVLGAKDFLPKPFEPDELILRVRLLLETRALVRRISRPTAPPG